MATMTRGDDEGGLESQTETGNAPPIPSEHAGMTVIHRKRSLNPGGEAGKRCICDHCHKNISKTVRVRCSECTDFDLCVSCFSRGTEVGAHKNDHPYYVVDQQAFPVLTSDWGADEELLLLEGAQIYGLGNWQAIAEHIGTRPKEECERHYSQVYVQSENWPLPKVDERLDASVDTNAHRTKVLFSTPTRSKPTQSLPANHEVAGYMPNRNEFELEYDNDAEMQIKDISFSPDDPPEEADSKVLMLDIYNRRLKKRRRRKELMKEYNLFDYKKNLVIDRKRSKEERDMANRYKVFAKVVPRQEHDEILEGILNEVRLRQQIAVLQTYRYNGIRTLSEGSKYEQDVATRPSYKYHIPLRETPERASPWSSSHRATPFREASPATPSATSTKTNRKPEPINIQDAEGVHLLSTGEQALCSVLRIFPRPYLVIKETILKEYARRGSLRRRQTRELIKIDVNKTVKIYDYFVEMGWIKPPPKPAKS